MKKKHKAPWGVIIAIILAVIIGPKIEEGGSIYHALDLVSVLFINALTLVVVPLVAASIISGVARIGSDNAFKRLGAKTLFFYLITTFLAAIVGVFFVNLIKPGTFFDPADIAHMVSASDIANHQDHTFSLRSFLLQVIPSNLLNVFAQGGMLGLIFFSMLFGYALSKITKEYHDTVASFFRGLFEVMIKIAQIFLKLLPLGVFCLVARSFAQTGFHSIKPLLLFSLTVLLALTTFSLIIIPLLLKFIAKVKPFRAFKAMMPALVTAFSTSSSSASIPITMECVEKRAGVSNKIASLVIPLGTSINLSGSGLYECVAALFVAQAYGIDLPLLHQFSLIILALFTSMGVAGIPAGSLVATIVIMQSIGLPVEGIGLFLAVDRFMDMARTTVNIFSDSSCAILVAATEGEKNLLTKVSFE